ncbi:MAG: electron transport complex subunit E [Gammaproteobacteria bacterium]
MLSSANSSTFGNVAANGLWRNNTALVQLLGLCPLLAVSNNTVNALSLGLATVFVLTLSNAAVSLIRHQVSSAIRLPTFVMIIAAVTTCIELLMQAFTFELFEILGIFIPLIVTNCAVLGRAESFACKNTPGLSAWDGAMTGLGFLWVLVLVGMIRELLGQGSLFANMALLLPIWPDTWSFSLGSQYRHFLLAALPPGAFFTVGFLIAIKHQIDHTLAERAKQRRTPVVAGSKRVRVTGPIS